MSMQSYLTFLTKTLILSYLETSGILAADTNKKFCYKKGCYI
jgi:hypothetical protein